MEYVLDANTSDQLAVILKNSFAVRRPDGRSYYHGDPIVLKAGSNKMPTIVTLKTGMEVFFVPIPDKSAGSRVGRSELVAIIFIGNQQGSTVQIRPARSRVSDTGLLFVTVHCRRDR